ncbi:sialate O-acetylesterase [Sunxiuqinia sp. A32]|uniref:sialate O-acetylesterase n=1 Tax=Sunxiuqinia sp. A32 TaxID=3461496 RepID=UPI0040463F1C
MKKTFITGIILALSLFSFAQDLSFSDVLKDHMVVQQNKPFKVWGTASPGTQVEINADWIAAPVVTTTDANGNFIGIVPVPKAKAGDYSKHWISIADSEQELKLQDVLIGDVWFCSGQSNMQFGMDEVINSEEELKKANYPNIRLFYAGLNFNNEPINTIRGEWKVCNPKSAYKFSAVAFYFGKEIHETLDIPVGIIFTGIGASSAQAYVSREVLASDPLLDETYLQPYLQSKRSKEKIDGGFSFEKVMRPYLLYNAIIHPFVNLSISGVAWYQGEANRHERDKYTHLMYKMIGSWRDAFGQGNFPFYYVQVAPFFYDIEDPLMADYAFFREAQEKISLLGNTEMVTTMDVGEAKDLHPKNKKPIGSRLAKTALNRHYGYLDVNYQGPILHSVDFEKKYAMVNYVPSSVVSGLRTNDGAAPKFFQIAGEDQIFHTAEAEIVGNQVKVWSKKVKNLVAVRYAFTNYPVTNLENGDGIAAVAFRTDHWKEPIIEKK